MNARATHLSQVPQVASPDPTLLGLLVCPKCRGSLVYREAEGAIDCPACQLCYPIVEGIPVLLVASAQSL